jgi:predicted RNase H-like nuclease (RuvC/YqgF family)
MSDSIGQRLLITAYEAQFADLKIQNKILLSKLQQKDEEIEILYEALSRHQILSKNQIKRKKKSKHKKSSTKLIKTENIEDELIPKQLRSNLNPATKYPLHDKESRKFYSKNKKFESI